MCRYGSAGGFSHSAHRWKNPEKNSLLSKYLMVPFPGNSKLIISF
jgi:hypothetical protein